MNATTKALHHYSKLAELARLEADQRDQDARIARLTAEVSEGARRIAEHTGNAAWIGAEAVAGTDLAGDGFTPADLAHQYADHLTRKA